MTPYTIQNDVLRVSASPRGAELQSVYHKNAEREALWQGDPRYWDGRAPNLFPFVARLNQGRYRYEGKTYALPLHGFLPSAMTKLYERTQSSMTFLLEDDETLYRDYPFRFSLYITYQLTDDTLAMTYHLVNRGENAMTFGLGAHPGFRIPFVEGTGFEDYYLAFDTPETPVRVLFNDDVLRTGEVAPYPLENGRLPLRHELFCHDAVVLQNAGHSVRIGTDKSPRAIVVRYPDMPQVGFWHAQDTDAPYVCVEPWATLPARASEITDFSTSAEVLRLLPGGAYDNTVYIQIAF